jgi:hypothetical protein
MSLDLSYGRAVMRVAEAAVGVAEAAMPVLRPQAAMPLVGGTDPDAAILRLQAAIRQFETLPIEPVHRFAGRTYAREMTIPAGALLISLRHRDDHIVTVSSGRITVFQPGVGTRSVEAPATFVSRAAGPRVGYAHEDTIWTTYHTVAEHHGPDDIALIEDALYETPAEVPYVEGDAEALINWLETIGRTPAGALPPWIELAQISDDSSDGSDTNKETQQ